MKREDESGASYNAAAGVRPSGGRISGDNLNTMIPVLEALKTGGGELRTFSAYPTGTYYLYAFDGRLLAEYNDMGFCVRDYIYLGGKMVAEHRPLKFSGKERDVESGLDYFGARYYDRSIYRFLTVDPVIPAGAATANPQRWNLYAYCLNNPVNYIDPTGKELIYVGLSRTKNAKNFRPFLDSEFYEILFGFILWAERKGIQLKFTDAYRTPGDHRAAQVNYKRAAKDISVHQCGFAADLSVKGFSDETIKEIKSILDELGLSYQGPYNNILHIYMPISDEDKPYYMTQALVDYLKLTGRGGHVYTKDDYRLIISFFDFLYDPFFLYYCGWISLEDAF